MIAANTLQLVELIFQDLFLFCQKGEKIFLRKLYTYLRLKYWSKTNLKSLNSLNINLEIIYL